MYGISNNNSIGIELCINSDGNYDKAFENTIDLTKYLMQLFRIPIEKVVRHYDASRKSCPGTMMKNNWEKWNIFKNKLVTKTQNNPTPIDSQADIIMKGLVTAEKGLNIRNSPSLNAQVLGVLPKNSTVEILSKEMNFYKIRNKNVLGYVNIDYIKTTWTKPSTTETIVTEQTYRVRKLWGDTESQLGAFQNLQLAKNVADKNLGYYVFDEKGNKVYSGTKING
jgi:N-acetylmuramoyl-L-alanine amidase CwlA